MRTPTSICEKGTVQRAFPVGGTTHSAEWPRVIKRQRVPGKCTCCGSDPAPCGPTTHEAAPEASQPHRYMPWTDRRGGDRKAAAPASGALTGGASGEGCSRGAGAIDGGGCGADAGGEGRSEQPIPTVHRSTTTRRRWRAAIGHGDRRSSVPSSPPIQTSPADEPQIALR